MLVIFVGTWARQTVLCQQFLCALDHLLNLFHDWAVYILVNHSIRGIIFERSFGRVVCLQPIQRSQLLGLVVQHRLFGLHCSLDPLLHIGIIDICLSIWLFA